MPTKRRQLQIGNAAGQRLARLVEQARRGRPEQQEPRRGLATSPATIDRTAQDLKEPGNTMHLVEHHQLILMVGKVPPDTATATRVDVTYRIHNTYETNMSRIPATAVRDSLSETLNRVAYKGERIVLERHGKAVAALVSIEDLELLEALEDRLDTEAVLTARDEPGDIPYEEVRRRAGLAKS